MKKYHSRQHHAAPSHRSADRPAVKAPTAQPGSKALTVMPSHASLKLKVLLSPSCVVDDAVARPEHEAADGGHADRPACWRLSRDARSLLSPPGRRPRLTLRSWYPTHPILDSATAIPKQNYIPNQVAVVGPPEFNAVWWPS